MAKPWTAEELAIMNQRYPNEGASDALEKILNRPAAAIYCKAMRLGCKKPAKKNRK